MAWYPPRMRRARWNGVLTFVGTLALVALACTSSGSSSREPEDIGFPCKDATDCPRSQCICKMKDATEFAVLAGLCRNELCSAPVDFCSAACQAHEPPGTWTGRVGVDAGTDANTSDANTSDASTSDANTEASSDAALEVGD